MAHDFPQFLEIANAHFVMTQNSSSKLGKTSEVPTRKWELGVVLIFVIVHLAAPLVIGERYPFTVAPMFRDQPSCYCTYEVEDVNGKTLDSKQFGLHLVYDGNPVGFGVGLKPVPTMHPFGTVPSESEVREYLRPVLESRGLDCVVVTQIQVRCKDHAPETTKSRWTVRRGGSE